MKAAMTEEPKVYVIIINWNQERDTKRCLDSLKSINYINFKTILVDNGSIDGSPDRIKENYPGITLIKNGENLGFAEGNNIGMRYALKETADYIFLLNNDTIIDVNVLKELVRVAESDEKIGILGAVNYSFENPNKAVMIYTSFNWFTGFTKKEPLKAVSKGLIVEPQEVHGVTGSSLLIKKNVIEKIGLLDRRFFIYYEDTDWCLRARRAGFKVLYVPKAKILHRISISFGQKSPTELYLYTRNFPLLMWKNCPRVFLVSVFAFYILKILVYFVFFAITGKAKHAEGIFAGFVDFCKQNFDKGHLEEFSGKNSANINTQPV